MRIERVDAELKKELSKLINSEIKDPRLDGAMISIMNVETTKDLKYSKVYVSILNAEEPRELLKILQKSSGFMRTELFRRLKIRAVPEFTFVLDESVEYGFKIEQILKDLNKN